jgi:tRNA G46 methylase TrmB
MAIRCVTSTQNVPHPALEAVVRKHFGTAFAKPIAEHTRLAFAAVKDAVNYMLQSMKNRKTRESSRSNNQEHAQQPVHIILDSCCGTGESTLWLAEQHPHALVIGVDKSAHRLARSRTRIRNLSRTHSAAHRTAMFHNKTEDLRHVFKNVSNKVSNNEAAQTTNTAESTMLGVYGNALVVRADVIDFWRLLADELIVTSDWVIEKHFLLYPNPYPKPHHLLRRWHGHPVFPTLLRLSASLEVRTNWHLYAEEFALAVQVAQQIATEQAQRTGSQNARYLPRTYRAINWTLETFSPAAPITAFERKYASSGQTLYRFTLQYS